MQLHQRSYDLHAALAKDLNISSYREIDTLSVQRAHSHKISPAAWLDGPVVTTSLGRGR